jgi:hypothetical protein
VSRTPLSWGCPRRVFSAKAAGHSRVIVDGTLIHTDRISVPGPTLGVDLWWSGKYHHHRPDDCVETRLGGVHEGPSAAGKASHRRLGT